MLIDKLLQVSTSQVLTATAASADVIDLGNARRIGAGRPLWLVCAIKAASGTSPTLQVTLQTDDASGFGSPASLASSGVEAAVAGKLIAVAVPLTNERFLRANYTVAGTSPSITVDTWLSDQEPSAWFAYADAI